MLAIFLVTSLNSFRPVGQNDDLLQRIISNLDQYNKLLPQEKLYMHIDKPYYIAGEDLFYKAYIVNALFLFQDSNTELVHVELRGKDGRILEQKIKAENGAASGNITLPDTLSSGSYTMLAYTNWMRNFSDDFVFNRQINIYQPEQEMLEEADQPKNNTIDKGIDVSFFPEGGNLVYDLASKVGFKAVDQRGNGIKVSGIITDEQGNTVSTFNALHAGIGAFILKPLRGKNYNAKVSFGNKEYTFAIPDAYNRGAVMQAINTRSNIRVTVQSNIQEAAGQFLLVAQANGQIYYSALGSEVTKGFLANIPKSELPNGITQLTLFNGEGMPLCERLVYIDNADTADVNINQDKGTYTPRDKVKLGISLAEFSGAKEGDLSISVTNRKTPDELAENINTYLMLSSDLNGKIEQPQFYFNRSNPYAAVGLDNLLLTQGWRRFIWKEVIGGEFSKPNFALESGLLVKGTLLDNENQPLINQPVLISMPNQLVSYTAISDENGRIQRYVYDYHGVEKLIVLPVDNPDLFGNMTFMPDTGVAEEIELVTNTFIQPSDQSIKQAIKRELENNEMMQAFDVVTYKEQSTSFNSSLINAKTNYRPLYNTTVNLADYISFPNMTEVFREIVPYTNIILNKRRARLYSLDDGNNFSAPPLFMVNGTPTSDLEYVLDLNPGDIESIGIINAYKNLINMGLDGEVGIICINSKTGRVLPTIPDESTILTYSGYTLSKEFYSPTYSDSDDDRLPDFRSLLYWNPDVKTDKNGEATVEFYTSDEIGSFEVNVQGITKDGRPIAKVASVSVSVQ